MWSTVRVSIYCVRTLHCSITARLHDCTMNTIHKSTNPQSDCDAIAVCHTVIALHSNIQYSPVLLDWRWCQSVVLVLSLPFTTFHGSSLRPDIRDPCGFNSTNYPQLANHIAHTCIFQHHRRRVKPSESESSFYFVYAYAYLPHNRIAVCMHSTVELTLPGTSGQVEVLYARYLGMLCLNSLTKRQDGYPVSIHQVL